MSLPNGWEFGNFGPPAPPAGPPGGWSGSQGWPPGPGSDPSTGQNPPPNSAAPFQSNPFPPASHGRALSNMNAAQPPFFVPHGPFEVPSNEGSAPGRTSPSSYNPLPPGQTSAGHAPQHEDERQGGAEVGRGEQRTHTSNLFSLMTMEKPASGPSHASQMPPPASQMQRQRSSSSMSARRELQVPTHSQRPLPGQSPGSGMQRQLSDSNSPALSQPPPMQMPNRRLSNLSPDQSSSQQTNPTTSNPFVMLADLGQQRQNPAPQPPSHAQLQDWVFASQGQQQQGGQPLQQQQQRQRDGSVQSAQLQMQRPQQQRERQGAQVDQGSAWPQESSSQLQTLQRAGSASTQPQSQPQQPSPQLQPLRRSSSTSSSKPQQLSPQLASQPQTQRQPQQTPLQGQTLHQSSGQLHLSPQVASLLQAVCQQSPQSHQLPPGLQVLRRTLATASPQQLAGMLHTAAQAPVPGQHVAPQLQALRRLLQLASPSPQSSPLQAPHRTSSGMSHPQPQSSSRPEQLSPELAGFIQKAAAMLRAAPGSSSPPTSTSSGPPSAPPGTNLRRTSSTSSQSHAQVQQSSPQLSSLQQQRTTPQPPPSKSASPQLANLLQTAPPPQQRQSQSPQLPLRRASTTSQPQQASPHLRQAPSPQQASPQLRQPVSQSQSLQALPGLSSFSVDVDMSLPTVEDHMEMLRQIVSQGTQLPPKVTSDVKETAPKPQPVQRSVSQTSKSSPQLGKLGQAGSQQQPARASSPQKQQQHAIRPLSPQKQLPQQGKATQQRPFQPSQPPRRQQQPTPPSQAQPWHQGQAFLGQSGAPPANEPPQASPASQSPPAPQQQQSQAPPVQRVVQRSQQASPVSGPMPSVHLQPPSVHRPPVSANQAQPRQQLAQPPQRQHLHQEQALPQSRQAPPGSQQPQQSSPAMQTQQHPPSQVPGTSIPGVQEARGFPSSPQGPPQHQPFMHSPQLPLNEMSRMPDATSWSSRAPSNSPMNAPWDVHLNSPSMPHSVPIERRPSQQHLPSPLQTQQHLPSPQNSSWSANSPMNAPQNPVRHPPTEPQTHSQPPMPRPGIPSPQQQPLPSPQHPFMPMHQQQPQLSPRQQSTPPVQLQQHSPQPPQQLHAPQQTSVHTLEAFASLHQQQKQEQGFNAPPHLQGPQLFQTPPGPPSQWQHQMAYLPQLPPGQTPLQHPQAPTRPPQGAYFPHPASAGWPPAPLPMPTPPGSRAIAEKEEQGRKTMTGSVPVGMDPAAEVGGVQGGGGQGGGGPWTSCSHPPMPIPQMNMEWRPPVGATGHQIHPPPPPSSIQPPASQHSLPPPSQPIPSPRPISTEQPTLNAPGNNPPDAAMPSVKPTSPPQPKRKSQAPHDAPRPRPPAPRPSSHQPGAKASPVTPVSAAKVPAPSPSQAPNSSTPATAGQRGRPSNSTPDSIPTGALLFHTAVSAHHSATYHLHQVFVPQDVKEDGGMKRITANGRVLFTHDPAALHIALRLLVMALDLLRTGFYMPDLSDSERAAFGLEFAIVATKVLAAEGPIKRLLSKDEIARVGIVIDHKRLAADVEDVMTKTLVAARSPHLKQYRQGVELVSARLAYMKDKANHGKRIIKQALAATPREDVAHRYNLNLLYMNHLLKTSNVELLQVVNEFEAEAQRHQHHDVVLLAHIIRIRAHFCLRRWDSLKATLDESNALFASDDVISTGEPSTASFRMVLLMHYLNMKALHYGRSADDAEAKKQLSRLYPLMDKGMESGMLHEIRRSGGVATITLRAPNGSTQQLLVQSTPVNELWALTYLASVVARRDLLGPATQCRTLNHTRALRQFEDSTHPDDLWDCGFTFNHGVAEAIEQRHKINKIRAEGMMEEALALICRSSFEEVAKLLTQTIEIMHANKLFYTHSHQIALLYGHFMHAIGVQEQAVRYYKGAQGFLVGGSEMRLIVDINLMAAETGYENLYSDLARSTAVNVMADQCRAGTNGALNAVGYFLSSLTDTERVSSKRKLTLAYELCRGGKLNVLYALIFAFTTTQHLFGDRDRQLKQLESGRDIARLLGGQDRGDGVGQLPLGLWYNTKMRDHYRLDGRFEDEKGAAAMVDRHLKRIAEVSAYGRAHFPLRRGR